MIQVQDQWPDLGVAMILCGESAVATGSILSLILMSRGNEARSILYKRFLLFKAHTCPNSNIIQSLLY